MVGNKIRAHREVAGMTQGELAEKLHIEPQVVSSWERGECLPELALVPDLTETLNMAYNELLDNNRLLEVYPAEQKAQFVRKCWNNAHTVERLCEMLNRWEQEDRRISEMEKEELRKRGIYKGNSMIISMCDCNALGLWDGVSGRRHDEMAAFKKEIGATVMQYVLIILYAGREIAYRTWKFPETNDPAYTGSVCDLFLTDLDDYMALDDPCYMFFEKKPGLVKKWFRAGLEAISQAV